MLNYVGIAIALASFFIAFLSFNASLRSNERASRPYVFATPFAHLENNRLVDEPRVIAIGSLQAPARVVSQNVSMYVENANGEHVRKVPSGLHEQMPYVIYPDPKQQRTVTTDPILPVAEKLGTGEVLKKTIDIKYQHLSGPPTYSFSQTWRFDPKSERWQEVGITAS